MLSLIYLDKIMEPSIIIILPSWFIISTLFNFKNNNNTTNDNNLISSLELNNNIEYLDIIKY